MNVEFIHMGIVLPGGTRESIDRYVQYGIPTGGFLRAVLANDLKEACGRADVYNQVALPCIVAYLYNECPATCWGSYDRVDLWLEKHEEARELRRGSVTA